jgi:hypothetical protein
VIDSSNAGSRSRRGRRAGSWRGAWRWSW